MSEAKNKIIEVKTKKMRKMQALELNASENLRCAEEWKYGDFKPYWANFTNYSKRFGYYR